MRIFLVCMNGTLYEKSGIRYLGREWKGLKGYYLFGKGIIITNRCW